MQLMAINSNNLNVINVYDGIIANNVAPCSLICSNGNITYAISLRRYYIESCNCNTIVPMEQCPLYCKTTNNLSTQIQGYVPYNTKYGTASMEKHCLLGATPTGLSIRRIAWHSSWICHVELQLAATARPSPNLGQVLQPSYGGTSAFFALGGASLIIESLTFCPEISSEEFACKYQFYKKLKLTIFLSQRDLV